jgi:hypothetical protein
LGLVISVDEHDNPLGSMLIAGGIGFALALLMTRRRCASNISVEIAISEQITL